MINPTRKFQASSSEEVGATEENKERQNNDWQKKGQESTSRGKDQIITKTGEDRQESTDVRIPTTM